MGAERPSAREGDEGGATAASPAEGSGKPLFKRRLPRLLLLVGMVGIIIHLFRSQPVLVDVTYEYGAGRRALQAARMRFVLNGTQARWVLFDYRRTPPPSRQRHQVKVLKGDYILEVELTYKGPPPAAVHGKRVAGEGGEITVLLERPLLVRGEGEVVVSLAD